MARQIDGLPRINCQIWKKRSVLRMTTSFTGVRGEGRGGLKGGLTRGSGGREGDWGRARVCRVPPSGFEVACDGLRWTFLDGDDAVAVIVLL